MNRSNVKVSSFDSSVFCKKSIISLPLINLIDEPLTNNPLVDKITLG
jgi:hypothetical protein